MVCMDCGDTKALNGNGVCRWRHGCEHRQMVQRARAQRVIEEAESFLRQEAAPALYLDLDRVLDMFLGRHRRYPDG